MKKWVISLINFILICNLNNAVIKTDQISHLVSDTNTVYAISLYKDDPTLIMIHPEEKQSLNLPIQKRFKRYLKLWSKRLVLLTGNSILIFSEDLKVKKIIPDKVN